MRRAPVLALAFVVLLLAGALPLQVEAQSGSGRLLRFPLTKFNDTLFADVSVAYRAQFDDDGDVWYTTTSGVVRVLVDENERILYTKMDGLPSSLALGLAIRGDKVYVGTDLGLAIIDRATGAITSLRSWNSELPDDIVQEVALDGDDLWIGTRFGGVATWNLVTNEWTHKNTSTTVDYAKPVRRILPTPTAVWVASDGNGAWRYDRATGEWNVTLDVDGLPSNGVLSIAEQGGSVFFGTDRGLARRAADGSWTTWNTTNGMPDDRVFDLDVIETEDGGADLFAATREGLWQLDPETGGYATRAQEFGILGSYIHDESWVDGKGWLFATTRGVSLQRGGLWTYYSTGPSVGATQGPASYRFTAAASGPDTPFLWFGSDASVSAFSPSDGTRPSVWYNLGEWSRYPGGGVNHIDVEGNTTWLATTTGAFGYDAEADRWVQVGTKGSLVYGVDAVASEVWIGVFGTGVIMRNMTTGVVRTWAIDSIPEPIPDQYITDVRVAGNDVWLGASIGAIRMDRVSGTFKGVYTAADGIPGNAITYRVLPDGPVVYVATRNAGLARLDVASGKVDKVWNATTTPGFPDSEIRALHREGGRLWAGTKAGLVRVDVSTQQFKVYNQTNSGLVQEFVNGITSRDGILYLATASGVARLDIATETFLPMQDGSGVVRGNATSDAGTYRPPVTVRIDSPRDGTGVTGTVEIRGTAGKLGGTVDRVEVRIGDGAWQAAQGTNEWQYAWDSSTATPNEPITIAARAIAANETSREADILVTPVSLPTIPLELDHAPIRGATAGRALVVVAKVTGDEPLSATLYYRVPGRDAYTRVDMTRQGALFTATIPGKSVQEGVLDYYVEAKSGLLEATSPADPLVQPHRVEVGPAPRVAVAIEGPTIVEAKAGIDAQLPLNVSNIGSEPGTYVLSASGLRASWISVPAEPITLEPGATRQIVATISVPPRAFADNTTVSFEVRDVDGVAQSQTASVPIRVLAAPDVAGPTQTSGQKPTPAPHALALLAVAALALALRRRRS